MKYVYMRLSVLIFVLLGILSCDKEPDAVIVQEVTSVTLSHTELVMHIGEEIALTAEVLPENATDKTVRWDSSDLSIAEVSSSGLVFAFAPGTAIITATAGGKSATCKVTVMKEGGGLGASIDYWAGGDKFDGTVE